MTPHELRIERTLTRRAGAARFRATCRRPCRWRGPWVRLTDTAQRHAVAHTYEGAHRAA